MSLLCTSAEIFTLLLLNDAYLLLNYFYFCLYFFNIYLNGGQQGRRKLSLAACHCTMYTFGE